MQMQVKLECFSLVRPPPIRLKRTAVITFVVQWFEFIYICYIHVQFKNLTVAWATLATIWIRTIVITGYSNFKRSIYWVGENRDTLLWQWGKLQILFSKQKLRFHFLYMPLKNQPDGTVTVEFRKKYTLENSSKVSVTSHHSDLSKNHSRTKLCCYTYTYNTTVGVYD